jgi:hypothetical protein
VTVLGTLIRMMGTLCILIALLWTNSIAADERHGIMLHFDAPSPPPSELNFEDARRLAPEEGDFAIIGYVPMSNEVGERWALVTIKNTAEGARLLKNEHVVATFADGVDTYARNLDQRLEGGAVFSQAVYFGASKFPIVRLKVR